NSNGEFLYNLTSSTCDVGHITVSMLGCLGIYDTLGLYNSYDSSKYNDTLEFNFKYCDTLCRGYDAYFFQNTQPFSRTANFTGWINNGTAHKYSWNFGNGWVVTGANPSYTYSGPGTYLVRLKAEDTVKGCVDSFQTFVTISFYDSVFVKGHLDTPINNKGIGLYYKTPWNNYLTHTVYTNSSGYYEGWAYVWDSVGTIIAGTPSCYGDSTFNDGNYTWYRDTITIDIEFCPDTLCNSFWVGINANTNIYTKTVSFTGVTTGHVFNWAFGDGNTSTLKSPSHTYNYFSQYLVKFVAQDTIKNCIDSAFRYVQIFYYDSVYVKGQVDTPVSGITVSVYNVTPSGTVPASLRQTTTNSSGEYGVWVYVEDSVGNILAGVLGCRNDSSYDMEPYYNLDDTVIVNIDFCPPPPTYVIGGRVYSADTLHQFDTATVKVWLIRRDTVAGDTLLTAVDSMLTVCCGFYYFTGVPAGVYLVKAAMESSSPYYTDYLPTYYFNASQWRNAGVITTPGSFNYANINMIAGINSGGPGFIGGLVSQGANKFGDPIEKVQVTLYTSAGVPVAYTYTNANGEYSFSNLAYGSYKVVVEIPGKPSEEYLVTLDANNESSSANNFEVNTKDIRKSGTTSVRKVAAAQLAMYPNPASSSVTILFEGAASETVTVSITDISGKTVVSKAVETISGRNEINVDVSGLQTGFYLVSLHSASGAYMGKVSISR
ncbi:MAG TPA: T9SS type A sorting domain-containing protein, partial [Bacteroidia bacterium]|nr:T9SS type A sorting domain-containing protein [Bacteroidia bacterium]